MFLKQFLMLCQAEEVCGGAIWWIRYSRLSQRVRSEQGSDSLRLRGISDLFPGSLSFQLPHRALFPALSFLFDVVHLAI